MKKIFTKKNVLRLLSILFLVAMIGNSFVYAELGNGLNTSILDDVTNENYNDTQVLNPVYKVFSTILLILQVCGLAGVVVMGVKYMYAGPEDKGQIKKTLIWVVVGTILAFGASSIIKFITNIGNKAMGF